MLQNIEVKEIMILGEKLSLVQAAWDTWRGWGRWDSLTAWVRGTGRPDKKQEIRAGRTILTGGGDPEIFFNGAHLNNNEGI